MNATLDKTLENLCKVYLINLDQKLIKDELLAKIYKDAFRSGYFRGLVDAHLKETKRD